MIKNEKLERIRILIRYLIFTERIDYKSIQKDIANELKSEKSVISRALNGDSKYLTDNFIDKLNSAFGNKFNLEWLLTGDGNMLREVDEYDDNNILHYTTADGLIGILSSMRHNFSLQEKSGDIKERRLIFHKKAKDTTLLPNKELQEYVKNFKWISFFKKKLRDFDFDNEREPIRQPKMFDQYADLHRGGCIEYSKKEITKLNPNMGIEFRDVIYESYPTKSEKTVKEDLYHKTYSYRDEQECRLIYNGKEEFININQNCISKIYLGCRFFEDKIKVAEFCRVVEDKNINPEKIVEIEVVYSDYLFPDKSGKQYSVKKNGVNGISARYPLRKITEFLSLEYRKKYEKYFEMDVAEVKINIREEKMYREKYIEASIKMNEIYEENRNLHNQVLSMKEELSLLKKSHAKEGEDASIAPRKTGTLE